MEIARFLSYWDAVSFLDECANHPEHFNIIQDGNEWVVCYNA